MSIITFSNLQFYHFILMKLQEIAHVYCTSCLIFICRDSSQPYSTARITRASINSTNPVIPHTAHSYWESVSKDPNAPGSMFRFLPNSMTIIWISGQRNTDSLPAAADGAPSVNRIGICSGRNRKEMPARTHPRTQTSHPAFLPLPWFITIFLLFHFVFRHTKAGCRRNNILLKVHLLIIFTFSSSFRFFLTSYAWLFIVFSLADLLLNASFSAVSFESA